MPNQRHGSPSTVSSQKIHVYLIVYIFSYKTHCFATVTVEGIKLLSSSDLDTWQSIQAISTANRFTLVIRNPDNINDKESTLAPEGHYMFLSRLCWSKTCKLG